MATRFRCPVCHDDVDGEVWNAHLVVAPQHKARLFALFVADHPDVGRAAPPCSGAAKIVAGWQPPERVRFGAAEACAGVVLVCGCGESFCAAHSMACGRCGRFACLRHRHSRRCPDCAPGRRAVNVGVPKHDPFTKETRKVFRRYVRPGPPVWPRLATMPTG